MQEGVWEAACLAGLTAMDAGRHAGLSWSSLGPCHELSVMSFWFPQLISTLLVHLGLEPAELELLALVVLNGLSPCLPFS